MFEFQIQNQDPNCAARTGEFILPRGKVKTPIFMPCGTKGMVKTMLPNELNDLGVELILGNTYHLHLRPGSELVAEKGGLPTWNRWEKPMLTDSGGFQVFSLSGKRNQDGTDLVKIIEDGVWFRSYLDGSRHFFSPEKATEIQYNLGADILMAFDECADANVDHSYAKQAMERTHRWFERSYKRHLELEADKPEAKLPQALFPIIQGGVYTDLRTESAEFLNSFPTKGIAIGGLAVGETKETMHQVLETVIPLLDPDKPRYLMGVGSPDDLIEGIYRGVDMFDCVLPTRLARHGAFFTEFGRQNLKNQMYTKDDLPLEPGCACPACKQGFSRSFIRHLFQEQEITALRLITMHNLFFLTKLMEQARAAINEGRFAELRAEFWEKWGKGSSDCV